MKTLLLTFLLFPLFYFSQMDANGWYLANTGADGTKNYIKNIGKKDSDTFTCWVKMVSPSKKNKKGVVTEGDYSLQFWTIYCSENQYLTSDTTKYDSTGKVLLSYDASFNGIKNAVPDSVAEGIILLVCDAGKMIQD